MSYVTLGPRHWGSVAIRGVVAILFGVATLVFPGLTLEVLVLLFGAYALLDGLVNTAAAWRASRAHGRWGIFLMQGVAGIFAGIVTFLWPPITAIALIYVVAAWSLVIGVMEIVAAIRFRKFLAHEWLLALTGALSVAFGAVLLIAPLAGALVIAVWIGVYALVIGVVLLAFAFQIRGRDHSMPAGTAIPNPIR